MPNVNKYVKFIKGSLSAFNKLSDKDNSTLYFITDNETGNLSLYLGNTLISSGNIDPEELSLQDLLDVTLSEELKSGNILTFNGTNWENTSLEVLKSWLDIPEMPGEMEGATESSDGLSGLVPVPTSADRGNFLSGDGKWTNIVPIISNEIKTELETITKDAPAAFDTLKEIADWISDDQAGATKLVTRVGNLEGLVETQGEALGLLQTSVGNLETSVNTNVNNITILQKSVGTLESDIVKLQEAVDDLITGGNVDLTGYVTTVTFRSVVGDLSNLNTSYIEGDTTNLVNEINGINERLTW
jgi:hypothetical protein